MGRNKNFQKDQKHQPQAGQQEPGGGRKNDEEVGEPIQLDDDKTPEPDQKQDR